MADPPSEAGAVQATVAIASNAIALTPVGAPGTVGACGVTVLLGAESALEPNALVAMTSNWYEMPLVKPAIVAPVGTTVEPGAAVTITSGTGELFDANELWTV